MWEDRWSGKVHQNGSSFGGPDLKVREIPKGTFGRSSRLPP